MEVSTRTFGQVVQSYLVSHRLKPSSAASMTRTLKAHFLGWWDRPIRSITRDDVASVLDSVANRAAERSRQRKAHGNQPGKAQTRKAATYVRAVFGAALADEVNGVPVLDRNPAEYLRKSAALRRLNRKRGGDRR